MPAANKNKKRPEKSFLCFSTSLGGMRDIRFLLAAVRLFNSSRTFFVVDLIKNNKKDSES
jgi:hypothetical protein